MRHGEVWIVDFEPSIGEEITKTRPAVIVNNDKVGALALRVVVPITDVGKFVQPWQVGITSNQTNNLNKDSLVDCFQLKSLSEKRFRRRIGSLSPDEMSEIKAAIAAVLDLI